MSGGAHIPPTLHYFSCRSRGQALRFVLWDAGVHFVDARVPVEAFPAWRQQAADPELGGPFASLPVLTWDGLVVAQTLAIAAYLSEKLGHTSRDPGLEARSLQWMVTSAAHLDTQVPYSGLLWLPADTPDERVAAHAQGLRDTLARRFTALERVFAERAEPGGCFAGEEPGVADWFVFESLDRARSVFGPAIDPALAACPGLSALGERLVKRPRIAAARSGGDIPFAVTASPSESAIRERLPGLL